MIVVAVVTDISISYFRDHHSTPQHIVILAAQPVERAIEAVSRAPAFLVLLDETIYVVAPVLDAFVILEIRLCAIRAAMQDEVAQPIGMQRISGKQCRAARGWLAMEARELACVVGVQPLTIRRFELGSNTPRPHTLDAIRAEFERRGIRFTFRSDGKPLGIEQDAD